MYTELILGIELKKDTPVEVIDTIKHLIMEKEIDNPLFKTKYYKDSYGFLCCGSYYFAVNRCVNNFRFDDISNTWILSSRSNQKNYKNDIESFLEWIKPYIEAGSGGRDMYAIVIYEENDEPTIYYLDKKEEDGKPMGTENPNS